MQRVMILGSSGAGKSTFAARLAALSGLPNVSLDAIYWQPGWKAPERAIFDRQVEDVARAERWIIDGNYLSHGVASRLGRADTLIWFDLPRLTCMTGVLGRIARTYGRVRPEMAPGCPEQIDLAFLRYVWTYRALQRPKLIEAFRHLRADQTLVAFRSRRDASDYLARFI